MSILGNSFRAHKSKFLLLRLMPIDLRVPYQVSEEMELFKILLINVK